MAAAIRLSYVVVILMLSFGLAADVVLSAPSSSGSYYDPNTFLLRPPSDGSQRHTMILPLVLSPPNPNTTVSSLPSSAAKSRRHLQKSEPHVSNARMPLHDDLLKNGYYTTRLLIGSPPQKFALIVDTGSTVTYVPCSTCQQCGKHQDPRFQPELSSTYQPIKCNIDCSCDSDKVQCTYERQYAEMSTSSGVLGKDVISFGEQSELEPQRAVFGCENVETGDLYSQKADGIMGLGRGELSIVDQLVDRGVISDSFSLCYGGMDVGGGAMVLGGVSPPTDMVFTHSNPVRSPYYNVELKELHVAGKALSLNPSVFDGKHGTVLDSGTTYAYLPEEAFVEFKEAIMDEIHSLKQVHGPDPNYNDICFSGAGSDVSELSKTFPAVDLVFENGHKLSLSPENYLFRHSKVRGAYCLGVFQNGKDPTTLLGGIVVRNTFVTYDREHEKIGFWKTNCSELWVRLNVTGAPAPGPSTSNRTNSSAVVPPAISPAGPSNYVPSESPAGPSDYVPSGEQKVGRITFYMSLDVTYSSLEPHIEELSSFMAEELHVNYSQVHVVNFTSEGKGSLIRWAISPARFADHIPNTTAMAIISRLAENRVHLPEKFGNYKFSRWSAEPPSKRTWWRRHYKVVGVAVIVTLLIGLLASATWFIWRRRQQTQIPYKPVDAPAPEQELQPL